MGTPKRPLGNRSARDQLKSSTIERAAYREEARIDEEERHGGSSSSLTPILLHR